MDTYVLIIQPCNWLIIFQMLQYRFHSIVHGMSMFIKKSKISRIKHFAIKITTLSGNVDDEKI